MDSYQELLQYGAQQENPHFEFSLSPTSQYGYFCKGSEQQKKNVYFQAFLKRKQDGFR